MNDRRFLLCRAAAGMRAGVVLAVAAVTLTLAGGCATTNPDDDYDSDLPWSTPEPWEGSPSIPGMDYR